MLEMLKTAEVAVMLRLHPNTIYNLAARKRLPAVRIGNAWLFPRDKILAMLQTHDVTEGELTIGKAQ